MGSFRQNFMGSCKKKKTTLRVMLYIFPTREKHTAVNVSANMQTVTGEKREKNLQRLARLQLFFSIFFKM